jgi:nucleoside diphosphate kinase
MNEHYPSLGSQFAVLIIKPEAVQFADIITNYLYENHFAVVRRHQLVFPKEKLASFYNVVQHPEWKPDKYFEHMTSGDSIVLFLSYENPTSDAQAELKRMIGDMNPDNARTGTLRRSLREPLKTKQPCLYVEDGKYWLNGVHCADNAMRAWYETCILYGGDALYGEYIKDYLGTKTPV